MDAFDRLRELSSQMEYEPDEDLGCPKLTAKQQDAVHVSSALLPNGQRITMLKTLLTSACERNCYYCPFRAKRDFKRATLKPEEMAKAFMSMFRAGIVQGIFLSSGIAGGGILTQDKLLDTAEILRKRYKFKGYLHLKLMPGSEKDQVLRSLQLASRVSLNLEAPNTKRLRNLAPRKAFIEELLQPLQWAEEIRRSTSARSSWNQRWPSLATQFVVGAVGESDLELLSTTTYLYRNLNLGRTYFSAFNPVPDTPLENTPPTNPIRQLRLYQASYLIRDYNFDLEELPFLDKGNLPHSIDPKTAWANVHLAHSPVEINLANKNELLRVPGLGPKGVALILSARTKGKLRFVEELHKIGIKPKRALPFILLDGKRPIFQRAMF